MKIAIVDDEWIRSTCERVREYGANVIGLVLEFRLRKVMLGRHESGKWHAVIEFADDDGSAAMRESFGRTPKDALSRLLQKCADIFTEFS
jgi:hypothetical protein